MTSAPTSHDVHFMEHALELARKGVGLASPNPTVGCVLVKDGAILGEGFHQYDWRDHAEIVALKQAGEKARGATMFVTLEPCNHVGRTGPCTEAIIAAGISRVVAAMEDPNPKTRGSGFARLRDARIEVETGVLESEAQRLNEAFAYWITTHRPFVTLKSALTLDGQLSLAAAEQTARLGRRALQHQATGPSGKPPHSKAPASLRSSGQAEGGRYKTHERTAWISSEESRAEVQRMRHASDALLTGIGTILADDPYLTDRSGLERRRRLLRVVVDTRLRLSPKSRIVQTSEDDLLVFTGVSLKSPQARKLQDAGVELLKTKLLGGKIDLQAVVKELGRREILSVLLEAGPRLNGAAIAAGIVHKLTLFYAPKFAGHCDAPLILANDAASPPLHVRSVQQFGPDVAIEVYLRA